MRPREVSATTTQSCRRIRAGGCGPGGISWKIEEEMIMEWTKTEGSSILCYREGKGWREKRSGSERETSRGCPPALVRWHSFHRPSRLFILLIGSSFFLPFVLSAASRSSAPTLAFDRSSPNFNLGRRLNARLCHLPPLDPRALPSLVFFFFV